jgi:hypothetical protein
MMTMHDYGREKRSGVEAPSRARMSGEDITAMKKRIAEAAARVGG